MKKIGSKKIGSIIRKTFVGDFSLWVIIMFLCSASIAVVYSSTAALVKESYLDNAINQAKLVALGLLVTWVLSWIVSPSWFLRLSRFLVIIFIGLSVLVYIPGVGLEINGAARWIKIPYIPSFCPFDFLRIFVMMDLVCQLSKRADVISKIKIFPDYWKLDPKSRKISQDIFFHTTIPIFFPSVVSILIITFTNFSTAVVLSLMVFLILWFGNVHKRELRKIFLTVMIPGSIFLVLMVTFEFGRGATIKERFIAIFSDFEIEQVVKENNGEFRSADSVTRELNNLPKHVYQKVMARVAVSSGGFFGKGPGNSTLRSQLPHSYDDCVYAFIIEEYGFFGGFIILFLYVVLLRRGCIIANRSKYYSFSVLATALVVHIFITAMLNMLVSVGIFVTGQTLPLISKGGSAMLANAIALGILIGISACPPRAVEMKEIENENNN